MSIVTQSEYFHVWETIIRQREDRQSDFIPGVMINLTATVSASCEGLETILEEDDEFQFSMEVEKLSKSGFMYNKRVLSIDQECLCYYSHLRLPSSRKINTLTHIPKVRLFIKDITDVEVMSDKSHHNCLKISGFGRIVKKGKARKQTPVRFSYTFRFVNNQQAVFWKKIIDAAQVARRKNEYLMTFDNLLKYQRADSS